MGNPRNDGMYGPNNSKHDCPKPLNGCRYPKCACDVDDDETPRRDAGG